MLRVEVYGKGTREFALRESAKDYLESLGFEKAVARIFEVTAKGAREIYL